MNLKQLRLATRQMLNDEAEPYLWEDDELNRYANNAVLEACIRARLLKDDAYTLPQLCQIDVVAGEPMLKLHKNVLMVRSGMLCGHHEKLWAMTADSMDRFRPSWDSDRHGPCRPQFMIMDLAQKTVRLWPTPDVNYTLRLRVWRTPLEKELMRDEGSEPVVLIPDVEGLKHWIAHEACIKKDAEANYAALAATYIGLFEQRFGTRPSLHEMARWADSPSRVRLANMF